MAGLNIFHFLILFVVLGIVALVVWGVYRLIAAGVRKGTVQANQAVSSGPPAGWYTDPGGSDDLRWWDGSVWTDHRKTAAAG